MAILRSLFAKEDWVISDDGLCHHGHGVGQTSAWIIGIIASSTLYFFLYFSPMHLHDPSHYATAGVSMVRDHKNLLYPYLAHGPTGSGNAYEYLQNGTVRFDVRSSYPSKLYSLVYGVVTQIMGSMRLEYIQWIAIVSFVAGNIFLYLIGRRFLHGISLLLFLLSVLFLPIIRVTLAPGSDGVAFTSSLALIWLCLCVRVNPFALGMYSGVLSQFRGQMLALLLVFPFIYRSVGQRGYFGALVVMAIGFAVTFGITTQLFNLITEAVTGSSPVDFYIHHFRSSFFGFSDIDVVLGKFVSNLASAFRSSELFIYAGVAVLCVMPWNGPLQRGLAWAAIMYAALPIITYSFDRLAPSQPRYYTVAVPLISLAAFTSVTNIAERYQRPILGKLVLCALTGLILGAWYSTNGIPVEQLKAEVVASKMRYLDFPGAEKALSTHFKTDDVVIINHSLPTGLSRLHNVIQLPPLQSFRAGDNSRIAGLVFVFGDSIPDDYFKPKDWFPDSTLPDAFSDSSGLRFARVYSGISDIVDESGKAYRTAHFLIYKTEGRP